MLPQFGFIVAQAGADSHPTTPNQTTSTSSHLTKPPSHDPYYYRSTRSPPSSLLPPPPPPPLPYMYTNNNNVSALPPPPPPDYYHPARYQPSSMYEPSSYRPLQPLPPPPPQQQQQQQQQKWHPEESYHWHPPIYPPQELSHPPPPPPPPVQVIQQPVNQTTGSKVAQTDDYMYDDPSSSFQRWPEETMIEHENKMLRRIREFKDLMSWMDTEFWEQCDNIYREKLQSLQEEIRAIQSGTHSTFKETLADMELRREQTIQDAVYFRNYELSLSKHQFDQEISLLQDEYESERHHLHEMVLQAIEERKKQVREDKEIETEFEVKDLFKDAYARVHNKRHLRKRAGLDRHQNASPSRQDRRRRAADRQATPHNIHAAPSVLEEEELEIDFMSMKGMHMSSRRHPQPQPQLSRRQ